MGAKNKQALLLFKGEKKIQAPRLQGSPAIKHGVLWADGDEGKYGDQSNKITSQQTHTDSNVFLSTNTRYLPGSSLGRSGAEWKKDQGIYRQRIMMSGLKTGVLDWRA